MIDVPYLNRHGEAVPWVTPHRHWRLPPNFRASLPADAGITPEMVFAAVKSQPNWWERYLSWHHNGKEGPIPA